MSNVNSFSEEELTRLLKLGDEPAFNELYDMHSKMLYSNILHLVKDKEIAKELLQDLFLKIWVGREKIDLDKSFRSFLFTIAKNMVYDYFRRAALDKRMTEQLIALSKDSYFHTAEALELKEAEASIREAINTLPPQSRQVYSLSKLEGRSHEEISTELGISISTVNNHMVKANKIVRAYLLKNSDLAVVLMAAMIVGNA